MKYGFSDITVNESLNTYETIIGDKSMTLAKTYRDGCICAESEKPFEKFMDAQHAHTLFGIPVNYARNTYDKQLFMRDGDIFQEALRKIIDDVGDSSFDPGGSGDDGISR